MTFIFATWAAKNKTAERIIIPAIDILQSVPVLTFLAITVPAFIFLFPHRMLGPECAAIFSIFTAQVWNMALSFYQSLITLPKTLYDVGHTFQLSPWQRFWRIEVPYAMPGLLWNAMMSMSGSWVFLIASEAMTVAGRNMALPGIGSYVAQAISQANLHAILYAIAAMIIVIILYDQILFRPLVVWSEKFKHEITAAEEEPQSWIYQLFSRSQLFNKFRKTMDYARDFTINNRLLRKRQPSPLKNKILRKERKRIPFFIPQIILIATMLCALWFLFKYLANHSSWHQLRHLFYLGLLTGSRVLILIILCSFIWLPVGVWIGLRPRLARWAQIVAQFFAAFPVNLLFPFVVAAILRFHLNINYWSAPLMVLGTQWYILFNVIAGASVIPQHQHEAVAMFHVKKWHWWSRLILPAVFPYYITGALTAAGGAWNMSIIAEALSWGNTHIYATGLGALITKVSASGDMATLTLATIVMSIYVVLINRILWKPLYAFAAKRFALGN